MDKVRGSPTGSEDIAGGLSGYLVDRLSEGIGLDAEQIRIIVATVGNSSEYVLGHVN